MTGIEYLRRRDLHPFWDESRDPNREDVAEAYEQGKADGNSEGFQEGAFAAEKKMKKRASRFIEVAIQQINKKHGLDLNVDNYVNNLIFVMEWEKDKKH